MPGDIDEKTKDCQDYNREPNSYRVKDRMERPEIVDKRPLGSQEVGGHAKSIV
jgi:hypothetical protein